MISVADFDPVATLRVAVFDDVVHARAEVFHIPGMFVEVFAHADDAVAICLHSGFDIVFMDFAMGADRHNGGQAVAALRAAGFTGRIVATSSDPFANANMRDLGADESLAKKAHLRSYLVHLGAKHIASVAALGKVKTT
jgi:CheY-like chemotaxis protein